MSSPRKTVLITGCSAGGLGAALVDAFLLKDYHVFATLRTPSKAPPHLLTLSSVTILTLDVLSPSSIASAVSAVTKKTGRKLDVLVNNSGIMGIMPSLDVNIEEEGKKMFDVNFWAALAMIQAFAPLLVESRGYVVNNASLAGVVPGIFHGSYNASKAALMHGSETWRLELALLGVKTLTLMSGSVKSEIFNNIPSQKVPEDSYYAKIGKDVEDLCDGRLLVNAFTAEKWATGVVGAVEAGKTGKLWIGGGSSMVYWATWLLPNWMQDMGWKSVVPWVKSIQR